MKMKKLGSLMMVGVLVGTMLVGCGKGSSSETKDAKKEGSSDAMKAVSYTHLDVYKRQPLCCCTESCRIGCDFSSRKDIVII